MCRSGTACVPSQLRPPATAPPCDGQAACKVARSAQRQPPETHSSATWPSALQPTPRQLELAALVPQGSVSLLHASPGAARQPGLSSAAGQLVHDLEASSRSAAAAGRGRA